MAAKLPLDTMIDILSRLPVKSLARFQCASKQCCVYIDNDLLGVLHGERTVEELTPIMYDPYLSSIVSFDIIRSEEGETTLEAKKGMSLESKLESKLRKSTGGSCNGLFYFTLHHKYYVTSLAVIHPIRKEYHELPPLQRRLEGQYYLVELSRGLGFDVSTNTFKMVCILSRGEFSKSGTFDSVSKNLCTMVHVLGMDSSWREIPQIPPYPTSGDGIFAHGCLYWLVSYQDSRQSNSREEFICFDVRNEEFTLINPPKKRCGYSVTYQLVDLYGEVGYAYLYSDNIIQVWVLNQIQWTKHCQFTLAPPLRSLRYNKVLGRWNKDGDILIETGGKNLFVYSLKDCLFSEVNIVGHKYGYNAYIYMYPASSLFSVRGIKKPTYLT